MSSTVGGVRIVDMPDLGAVKDSSSFVGEGGGSGRFLATALLGYISSQLPPVSGPPGPQGPQGIAGPAGPAGGPGSLPSATIPLVDGAASAGSMTAYARGDHVHPTDVSRYAASNPSGYQTAAQLSGAIAAAAYALPVASTSILGGVKVDGTTVTIASGVISAAVSSGGIPDAPSNGNIYGRMNATWVTVPTGGAGIADAPNDATLYGRKSLGWTHLTHADITDWTTTLAPYAPLLSPVFTGTPSLPTGAFGVTQAPGTSGTTIATTAFVGNAVSTGVAASVTAFNTRTGAVTLANADVVGVLPPSSTTPAMNGAGAAGVGTTWARGDHVHPTDSTRAAVSAIPLASTTTPAMNGAAAVGTGTTWARADHVHPTDAALAARITALETNYTALAARVAYIEANFIKPS